MTQHHHHPTHEDAPLPADPGHVRARQHYEAMLAELRAEQQRANSNGGGARE